jgi:glycosyltransferase A (GT-A) superfamily protein (DUF2064 family)
MTVMEARLVIFLRYPAVGLVKTRLIPALGEKGAARLYRNLAEHMVRRTSELNNEMEIELRYDGARIELFRQWLGETLCYSEQDGGSLGEPGFCQPLC